MTCILFTGGAGYIGSHTAQAILVPMALFPPGKLAAAICRQALSHSLAAG